MLYIVFVSYMCTHSSCFFVEQPSYTDALGPPVACQNLISEQHCPAVWRLVLNVKKGAAERSNLTMDRHWEMQATLRIF